MNHTSLVCFVLFLRKYGFLIYLQGNAISKLFQRRGLGGFQCTSLRTVLFNPISYGGRGWNLPMARKFRNSSKVRGIWSIGASWLFAICSHEAIETSFATIFQSFAISSIFWARHFIFWILGHIQCHIKGVFSKQVKILKLARLSFPKWWAKSGPPPRGSQGKNIQWLIGLSCWHIWVYLRFNQKELNIFQGA